MRDILCQDYYQTQYKNSNQKQLIDEIYSAKTYKSAEAGIFFKEGLLEASRKRRKLRYNKKADKIMQEAVESAGKYFFPKSGMC